MVVAGVFIRDRRNPMWVRPLSCIHTLIAYVKYGTAFVGVPYSAFYRDFLEPAALRLREAAALTTNDSLRKFLNSRADAFLSDDYRDSDMAWMDLTGPIEVVIGPYCRQHVARNVQRPTDGDGADVECAVEVKSSAVILRNAARDCETQATAVPVRRAAARKPLLHTAQVLGGNTFSVISNRELNLTA